MQNIDNDFSALPISAEVRRAIDEMGYREATVIQSRSIPVIMSGRDVIGHSQTGTGKTAAFGIPAIEKIDPEKKGLTQVLILCPTRELAMQSSAEMHKFAKYKSGIRIVPIYGGQPIERQIQLLKRGVEIIIGTPGRVMDHMRRKTIKLDNISMIILDEADEMLNMGFREDIEIILTDVPKDRQTLLFSATMSDDIMRITTEYQTTPVLVKVVTDEMTLPAIQQYFYDVPKGRKTDVLVRLFDLCDPKRSMVFCNTKKMVDELVSELRDRGQTVEGLHGDMKQVSRTIVMEAFKGGKVRVLIATDVAARGLDVDDVDIVFNYDLPADMEYYVHRIGRTGRMGKGGVSYTLISGRRELSSIYQVERATKAKIKQNTIPSLNEVAQAKNGRLASEIKDEIENGVSGHHRAFIERLEADGMDKYTVFDIACALLKMRKNDISDISGEIVDELLLSIRRDKEREREKKYGKKTDGKKTENRDKKDKNKVKKSSKAKILINIGKNDKVTANHLLGAIAGETGLSGKDVGGIDIYDTYTIAEVPKDNVNLVVRLLQGVKIRGKKTVAKIYNE
jgi:ATP-dependent RNA helicase DeaD